MRSLVINGFVIQWRQWCCGVQLPTIWWDEIYWLRLSAVLIRNTVSNVWIGFPVTITIYLRLTNFRWFLSFIGEVTDRPSCQATQELSTQQGIFIFNAMIRHWHAICGIRAVAACGRRRRIGGRSCRCPLEKHQYQK